MYIYVYCYIDSLEQEKSPNINSKYFGFQSFTILEAYDSKNIHVNH